MSYEVIKSEVVYTGKIIKVVKDELTMPDGKTAERETVLRGNAVTVVAVDSDDKIILVKQYRHGAKQMVLEIPAGMIDEGEEPIEAVARELEEETGYKSDNITFINEVYLSIGMCDEKISYFVAENLKEGQTNPDPDEFIEVEKYTLDECLEMLRNGEIVDAKTMAGILAYKEYIFNKK